MNTLKCDKHITTQQADYTKKSIKRDLVSNKPQTDNALVSGHWQNNLKTRHCNQETKTWPELMTWREDYKEFVKRLKICDDPIYGRHFKCPSIRYDVVENELKNSNKSIYSVSYSPQDYKSLYKQKTFGATKVIETDFVDRPTTYGNYYNRIQDIERFKNKIYLRRLSPIRHNDREVSSSYARKYFKKYNNSTYYDTICMPALEAANGDMPRGVIDRHMLRRQ